MLCLLSPGAKPIIISNPTVSKAEQAAFKYNVPHFTDDALKVTDDRYMQMYRTNRYMQDRPRYEHLTYTETGLSYTSKKRGRGGSGLRSVGVRRQRP